MTAFHPFEVTAAHLAYTFLGGFVVIFGMLSLFLKEKLYIGEAPIATVTGIIIGPHALKLFNPTGWAGGDDGVVDEITLEVTRVVISISVFAVGVELPKAYMKRHWRSLFFLLGPCMLWGWMISALLVWGLIPGLNFLASLVIAAGVTPTDPILAQAVVGGKFADQHVPAHIRHLLSAESGSNDGAAFPFLYIALYLLLDSSPGHAVGEWFYMTWLYEIVLGIIIGALLGFAARKFMKFAERKRLIDRQSYVAQYVSLAVLSIGITSLLGSDDLLSAFACGCAFAWDGFFNKATEDAVFSNVIDLLFNCAAFIYIGAIIPFAEFNMPDLRVWRLVVLAICILLIRRLPAIVATYKFIPDIKTFREALFTGWFGPMGVGAIFISTLARVSLPEGEADENTEVVDRLRDVITPITAFLVLSSVVTHGMSIPFFSLGRRVHSITYTRSRNLSMDTRGDEPAWTTHARRIQPGQEITINRDDDEPEEGDLGIRRRDTLTSSEHGNGILLGQNGEKLVEEDSGGSSSSRTRHGNGDADGDGEEIEMTEKRHEDEGNVRSGSGEGRGTRRRERERRRRDGEEVEGDSGDETSHASGSGSMDEAREGDETIEDGRGGRGETPPLAEFREGHHLIIERKHKDSDEVEVEVIRNHFHDDKPSEREKFTHPRRLKSRELDEILTHLPKSLEHATSRVQNEGKDAVDRLGLGLMGSHSPAPSPSGEREERDYGLDRRTSPEALAEEGRAPGSGEAYGAGYAAGARPQDDLEEDYEDVSDEETTRRSARRGHARSHSEASSSGGVRHHNPPAIHVSRQDSGGPKHRSIRSRLFGKNRAGSTSPSRAEKGHPSVGGLKISGPTNPALLSPPSPVSRTAQLSSEPERMSSEESRGGSTSGGLGIPLTRTISPSRSPAVRFAPEASGSSDTAPAISNYGANAPGFKKNPALAMYRSASVQSTGSQKEGPSVSFKEPEIRR
ncbi:hypothetical protein IAT38_007980 [Cryptococcus sp. DSM 104549]